MSALSTKDKLRLRISKERVSRWNALREQWATEPVDKRNKRRKDGTLIRCAGVITGGTDWNKSTGLRKAVGPEVILPDKLEWE